MFLLVCLPRELAFKVKQRRKQANLVCKSGLDVESRQATKTKAEQDLIRKHAKAIAQMVRALHCVQGFTFLKVYRSLGHVTRCSRTVDALFDACQG